MQSTFLSIVMCTVKNEPISCFVIYCIIFLNNSNNSNNISNYFKLQSVVSIHCYCCKTDTVLYNNDFSPGL